MWRLIGINQKTKLFWNVCAEIWVCREKSSTVGCPAYFVLLTLCQIWSKDKQNDHFSNHCHRRFTVEANSRNMIFRARESITAVKHLQVILFSQLHLHNSTVRKIHPSFTSEEHCCYCFTEITGIQGYYTNLPHGVWIPCLSLAGSKAELSAFSR